MQQGQIVRIAYSQDGVIQAMENLARRDLSIAFRQTVVDAARVPKADFSSTVPRSSGGGPHLADSLGILARIYKNGLGAYAVIGEKIVNGRTMVKNFHALERGTVPRFRKRIGGKFAWVEQVIANMPDSIKQHKRRTEQVIARHYLRDSFDRSVPAMINALEAGVRQRLMVLWTDSQSGVPT